MPTAIWDNTYGRNSSARYTATPRRGRYKIRAASNENSRKLVVPVRMNLTVFHSTFGTRSSSSRCAQLSRPIQVGAGATRSQWVKE
jgi:hypothetical protein